MEQELRYERKFYVTDLHLSELMRSVHLNSAIFSEIHHQRQINNIYFDSLGFDSYYDNVDGATYRIKARIRWYGSTFGIAQPTLEFKIKKGLMGYKRNFKLQNFEVDSSITKLILQEKMLDVVKDDNLRMYIMNLQPVLLNVYTRKYFSSFDQTVRLTVDTDLHYYPISNFGNSFLNSIKDDKGIVVELKYDLETEARVNQLSAEFPFLMTKNSKYLQGLTRVLGMSI
jgi:SPX domain protein involved in polyphosphate accumulation